MTGISAPYDDAAVPLARRYHVSRESIPRRFLDRGLIDQSKYEAKVKQLIVLKNDYPSAFPTLWGRIDTAATSGKRVSVREVFNELHNDNDTDFIQDWAKDHKNIFASPSNDELLIVQQILAIPHFQTLLSTEAILKGTPVADPFVVAAAKHKGATVVTQEGLKPNAAKVPNVCQHFGVPCLNLEAFMAQQGWTF